MERTLGWGAFCCNSIKCGLIVLLSLMLAAIAGYYLAQYQDKNCAVDRAKWAAAQRQVTAHYEEKKACEKKMAKLKEELEELIAKYNEAALDKKGKEVLLEVKQQEERKELQAAEAFQEKLQECNVHIGALKNRVSQLEHERDEMHKKLQRYGESIHAESRGKQKMDQWRDDEL